MLEAGRGLDESRLALALKCRHELNCINPIGSWVLPWCLLASAPPRFLQYVRDGIAVNEQGDEAVDQADFECITPNAFDSSQQTH